MKFKLRKTFLTPLFIIVFFHALTAQSLQDGIKQVQMENYQTAEKIFKHLVVTEGVNAENYYQFGNLLCEMGKYDSAKIVYTQGTVAAPKSYNNFIGLGKIALGENKLDEAMTQFTKAKSLSSPKDINFFIDMADAYSKCNTPNGTEAINNCKKGEDITTKEPRLYLAYADAFLSMKQSGSAVTNFENAALLDSKNAYPLVQIGHIWILAQNWQQALESLTKAKSIDSSFATLWRELAEVYYNMNKVDDATKAIEKYLTLADKTDENMFRYAQFLFLSKQFEKAMQVLTPLMKTNPENTTMMRLAGYSNYELGNYQLGQQQMEMFFSKRDIKTIIASDYEYYGRLQMKNNQDSLAAINFTKTISIDSTKCSLWSELANKNYTAKKYDKAALYFENAISCSAIPDMKDIMSLGRAYFFDSLYSKADTAFMLATKVAPEWPIGYRWRAISNLNMDNSEKPVGLAIPFYIGMIEKAEKDSVKYVKELKEGYKYLGDIYTFNEDYEHAVYYYSKYLTLDPENQDVKTTLDSIKKLWKGN